MTVRELLDQLEDMPDDAEVFIMSQPHWPFEYSVSGICTREDILNEADDEDDTEDGETVKEDDRGEMKPSDVFLCEGTQLRYGTKVAWEVSR